jgi:hypothetical protein
MGGLKIKVGMMAEPTLTYHKFIMILKIGQTDPLNAGIKLNGLKKQHPMSIA